MATVVQPRRNTLGEGLASAITKGFESYTNAADQSALQKSLGSLGDNPTPRQILDAVTGTKTYSPEAKQSALKNYLGVAEFEELQRKSKAREELESRELSEKQAERLEKTKAAQEKATKQQNEAITTIEQSDLPEEKKKAYLDAAKKGEFTPASARAVTKKAEPQYEKESEKLAAQRTSKYIGNVEEHAKTAQDDLLALNLMDSLGEAGATGFKVENALADYLESKGVKNVEAIRNPLSKAYNSVSKILMGGFGDIVKGKVSNFEFGIFKGMLAQAEDRPEAAKAMIESQRLIRNIDIAENQILQEIIQSYEDKGQSPPSNVTNMVEKRLRPIADQMTRETTDRMRNILKPGTKVQNLELNQRLLEQAKGMK